MLFVLFANNFCKSTHFTSPPPPTTSFLDQHVSITLKHKQQMYGIMSLLSSETSWNVLIFFKHTKVALYMLSFISKY